MGYPDMITLSGAAFMLLAVIMMAKGRTPSSAERDHCAETKNPDLEARLLPEKFESTSSSSTSADSRTALCSERESIESLVGWLHHQDATPPCGEHLRSGVTSPRS